MLLRQTDGQIDPPIFAQNAGVPMRSLLRLCNVVRRTLGRLLLIFSNHPTLIVSWLELLARTVIFKMVSAFCMKLHTDYNMTILFKNIELKNKTKQQLVSCGVSPSYLHQVRPTPLAPHGDTTAREKAQGHLRGVESFRWLGMVQELPI